MDGSTKCGMCGETIVGPAVQISPFKTIGAATSGVPMKRNPDLPYYLIIAGGALTLLTSIAAASSAVLYYERFLPLYFGSFNEPTALILTLLPSIVILYLGRLYLSRPGTKRTASLIVIVMSVVSTLGVVLSGYSPVLGLFFSGPPISFLGGIFGLASDR